MRMLITKKYHIFVNQIDHSNHSILAWYSSMARFLLVLLILAATKNLLKRFNHSFQRKLIVDGSTFRSNATIGAKDDIAIPLRTHVDR